MKHLKTFTTIFVALALLGITAISAVAQAPETVYTCLPSCEENDSRMLSIAGSGYQTLEDGTVHLGFSASPSASSIEIGIFDGDTGKDGEGNNKWWEGHWDSGYTPLEFTIFVDPFGIGAENGLPVAQWTGDTMPDNEWFIASIPTIPEAQSPSGNFFYHLRIRTTNPGTSYYSNFKIRGSEGVVYLLAKPFSYTAMIQTKNEAYIIYPGSEERGYFDFNETTYDGSMDFYFYTSAPQKSMTIWDGDVDFGSYDLIDMDSNDLDTPDNVKPIWDQVDTTNYEGIAIGTGGSTGDPTDNSSNEFLWRLPSVVYELTPPGLLPFLNDNPSGNREWEQFRIDIDPSIPQKDYVDGRISSKDYYNPNIPADFYVDNYLPAGLYHISMSGLDMHNLNAWRFPLKLMGVCSAESGEAPKPCKPPLGIYKVGDQIFSDSNGNGIQDNGEIGISGVVVYLLGSNGQPILDIDSNPIETYTDETGAYYFTVDGYTEDLYTGQVLVDGVYTVQVAPENFLPGGVLENAISTTGGESQTNTVIAENMLTYDFGYRYYLNPGTGTIGYWKNHLDAWPVNEITIGGVTLTRDEAVALMNAKSRGDKTYDLFAQLVAAKLNVLIDNDPTCISADIQAADDWLAIHPVGSGVKAAGAAWKEIEGSHTNLDNYNNGLMCVPHRD